MWPARLLAIAVRRLPPDRRQWGEALLAELDHVPAGPQRWRFALGGARVALFPPSRTPDGGWVRTVAAGSAAGLAAVAGLLAHAFLPAIEVFAVAFVLLVGCYATVVLSRRRLAERPARRRTGPCRLIGAALLIGVATVIVLVGSAAVAYPAAAADPTHVYSIVLAATLAAYVGFGLTPPRVVAGTGGGLGYGAVVALVAGTLWALPMVGRLSPGAWLAATGLVFAGATVAGWRDGSPVAGIRTGVWAGLGGALVMFAVGMATALATVRGMVTDPGVLADFHRSRQPDAASFLVSDDLGGLIAMLLILPAWTLLLGALGGALGAGLAATPARPARH